jgi:hypothetical protein
MSQQAYAQISGYIWEVDYDPTTRVVTLLRTATPTDETGEARYALARGQWPRTGGEFEIRRWLPVRGDPVPRADWSRVLKLLRDTLVYTLNGGRP